MNLVDIVGRFSAIGDKIEAMFSKAPDLSARVEELSGQVATLTTERDTFKAERDSFEKEAKDAKEALATAEAEHKTALEAESAKVDKLAAEKAAEIVAEQGVPPVPQKPDEPEAKKIIDLKGRDKFLAAMAAQRKTTI